MNFGKFNVHASENALHFAQTVQRVRFLTFLLRQCACIFPFAENSGICSNVILSRSSGASSVLYFPLLPIFFFLVLLLPGKLTEYSFLFKQASELLMLENL